MSIATFLEKNFKHFNARETLAAAKGWVEFCDNDGKMFVSLAGAMSTAEIGISLAPLIRAGKVHAISCTGANIEEDLFNLIGNSRYKLQPNWRYLSMEDDLKTRQEGYNRVTDTCIPEDVMDSVEAALLKIWQDAENKKESFFHWEYIFKLFGNGFFNDCSELALKNSWVKASFENNVPIYTPGWEDSTLGNSFAARVYEGKLKKHSTVKSGTELFLNMCDYYKKIDTKNPIGFFQIGGGIAGDFAMCTVPSILLDQNEKCNYWQYFCHIGDAITSYGGYSGCPPNEKVTWHKLGVDTPNFTINSDASIVAPLVFQYVIEKHIENISKDKSHSKEREYRSMKIKSAMA